jgi:hypothetical protein
MYKIVVTFPDGGVSETSEMSKAQAEWVAKHWIDMNPDTTAEIVSIDYKQLHKVYGVIARLGQHRVGQDIGDKAHAEMQAQFAAAREERRKRWEAVR